MEARTLRGVTPLMEAAHSPISAEAMTLLLEAGAHVSATDNVDYTALHHVAHGSLDPKAVEVLALAGAFMDPLDEDGQTPFMLGTY